MASTVYRNLLDDPLAFALLAGRRFAPTLRARLPQQGAGLVPALGAFLADRRDDAAQSLIARGRGFELFDPLAARLAIATGVPAAIPDRLSDDPRVLSSLAWEAGALSHSVSLLSGSNSLAARRRRSELALLEPGGYLDVTPHPSSWTRREQAPGKALRVLHVLTNSLPHTRSGYTARTHSILRACQEQGMQVSAVTRLGYPTTIGRWGVQRTDVIDGVPYHRLLAPSLPVELRKRLESQVTAMGPIIEDLRPHILHTTTDYTNALVTEAASRRYGIPWVYEMRGQLELTWAASKPAPMQAEAFASERVRLLRDKEADLARRANGVVVLSQVQADELLSRGVTGEHISVAPNSIDPSLLERSATPAEARGLLGLPTEGVWAGTVSSLVGYEGLETFLKALAEVRRGGTDLRAAVVGDGVSRPGLMALADTLGLTDSVAFPGRVPKNEAVQWTEALDIFVVPRRDVPVCRMVTPLKPLDALALGRPILASDLPALREVTRFGGVALPPEDVPAWARALRAMAAEPEERLRLGAEGRAAVAGRTWHHVAQTMQSIYEREVRGE